MVKTIVMLIFGITLVLWAFCWSEGIRANLLEAYVYQGWNSRCCGLLLGRDEHIEPRATLALKLVLEMSASKGPSAKVS
jgi:hypothetical protein